MANLPDIIDTRTAAAELGVSLRRVQQFIESGRLPAMVVGGSYAIRRSDLSRIGVRKTGRPKQARKDATDKPARKGRKG